jgi:hypothetical protein
VIAMQTHLRAENPQAGFTFAELAFALLMFVIGAIVLINHLMVNYSSTRLQQDRVFAFSKAQAMLAEIQSFVDRGEAAAAIDLDAFDDGVTTRPTLSITTDGGTLVPPDHSISGNMRRGGVWQWSRRITVQPFAGLTNRNMRYVTVRIFKRAPDGVEQQMAELSSVINSVGSAFPTTQVFDVYMLAIENIPGWWVYMDAIRPFVESTITDLESRNPGVEVRTHWITKASYGRNKVYRPYLNATVDSLQNVPEVYYYPGLMPAGSSSTYYYVPDLIKARMSFDGVEVNGYQPTETAAGYNPFPYAPADYFNHAMRLPQEQAYHDARVAAIRAAKENGNAEFLADDSEEPTLRLFLEDLSTNPARYRNALIINLHGELLPMPALRNYSDAARAPEVLPNVRVVAHPEELRTASIPNPAVPTETGDVKLRVYAYTVDRTRVTLPSAYAGPRLIPGDKTTANPTAIAVQVMGVDLTGAAGSPLYTDVRVENLAGGVPVGILLPDWTYKPFTAAKHRTLDYVSIQPNEMHYDVRFVDPGPGQEKYTLFRFYNTPIVAPPVNDGIGTRGLYEDERSRLYGMEYVPGCTALENVAIPVSPFTVQRPGFARDLYTAGAGPKNTARWVITIPNRVLFESRFVDATTGAYTNPGRDTRLTFRTRIWDPSLADPMATGTVFPNAIQPENLSETYTWWTTSAASVPITERSQFQGDPRHNPYKDLYRPIDGLDQPDFPNAYNWYHDTLVNGAENAAADFPGINAALLRNTWDGRLRQDLPRFLEILRSGLVTAQTVYTSLTGWSYYYVGFGNEVGYDSSNGYANSIPSNLRPFGTPAGTGFVNTITGDNGTVAGATNTRNRQLVRSAVAINWFSIPWLGELSPDSAYLTQWLEETPIGSGNYTARGNLRAGSALGEFYQSPENTVYLASGQTAFGTAMTAAGQRTAANGCGALINNRTGAGVFNHEGRDGQSGSLVDAGPELANNYNFPMPATTRISRPWRLHIATAGGPEQGYAPYSTNRFVTALVRMFYNHQSGAIGSGLVRWTNTANTSSAYVIVNGIDRTLETGSAFIAKYAMLSMFQSYFEAANPLLPHRILAPARVVIEAPTEISELVDPATVSIQWDVEWRRWDGQPYTANTLPGFTENETDLEYVLMYSRDSGDTWLHVSDETVATPGTKPTNPAYLVPDSTPGQETYVWPTPAGAFPEGSYLLRIEAYRRNQALHYSQHQAKIFIDR